MDFYKYEATGNDFVLIDSLDGENSLSVRQVKDICNRHTGIGADGILLLLPSETADVKMRIFNADGSEAEMCGNGARALALHFHDSKDAKPFMISIETLAGIRKAKISVDGPNVEISINMGVASLKRADIPMKGDPDEEALQVQFELADSETITGTCVSMGNPHCVVFVEDVNRYPLDIQGPKIENDPVFTNKTNVEFVEPIDSERLRLRVWERGVGETLACGTGTCAAVVAAHRKGLTKPVVSVTTRGGELKVDCGSEEVILTGPARLVFKGTVNNW